MLKIKLETKIAKHADQNRTVLKYLALWYIK